MDSTPPGTVTILIDKARLGDLAARERLFQLLLERLENQATGLLKHDRMRASLSVGDLVQETVKRLLQEELIDDATDRAFLFGCAARRMRQVLLDHARRAGAGKHGGQDVIVHCDELIKKIETDWNCEFLNLHESLEQLGDRWPEKREVVDLRYFAGLTIAETAQTLGVADVTVERRSRRALAKLRQIMSDE